MFSWQSIVSFLTVIDSCSKAGIGCRAAQLFEQVLHMSIWRTKKYSENICFCQFLKLLISLSNCEVEKVLSHLYLKRMKRTVESFRSSTSMKSFSMPQDGKTPHSCNKKYLLPTFCQTYWQTKLSSAISVIKCENWHQTGR